MRTGILAVLVLSSCNLPPPQEDIEPWAEPTCDALFGSPGPNTGLTDAECKPEVELGDQVWEVPEYDADDLAALREWTLENPPDLLDDNPYDAPINYQEQPDKVCGMRVEKRGQKTYTLHTYDSPEEAREDDARVTHGGACGTCSSLADLAVYIEEPDLTTPVRNCGLLALGGNPLASVPCLEDIGFTEACAQTWAYNASHTSDVCLQPCLGALTDPYHDEDGSLNECIQCDEDESGDVFKGTSGRTRRNSGLPTALCRPCEAVWRLEHRY